MKPLRRGGRPKADLPVTATCATLEGGCHCGAITLAFSTTLVPAATAPRACDCSFCRAHGATWASDPEGRLAIFHDPDSLHVYRQGSLAAQFLLCSECGVLVAVMFEAEGARYAAVNVGCLDARDDFASPLVASPQTLPGEEKAERWRKRWVADVRLLSTDGSRRI